mgnify:CR=1 FL=1
MEDDVVDVGDVGGDYLSREMMILRRKMMW